MTFNEKWRILQLFAGEGAGAGSAGAGGTAGDGGAGAAASGDGTADAAQRLREMGVPESKIAKYGKAYANRAKKSAVPPAAEHQKTDDNQQAAAANENAQAEETEQKNGAPKYDWDEVMKDPEMNRRMQETVRMSKKKSQAAEDAKTAEEAAEEELPALPSGDEPEIIEADDAEQADVPAETIRLPGVPDGQDAAPEEILSGLPDELRQYEDILADLPPELLKDALPFAAGDGETAEAVQKLSEEAPETPAEESAEVDSGSTDGTEVPPETAAPTEESDESKDE